MYIAPKFFLEPKWNAYVFEHIFYVYCILQSRLQLGKFVAYVLCLFQGKGDESREVEMSECLTENELNKKE
jgi:hypothetical protein